MTPADSAIARRLRVQCERFGWFPGMAISGPTWGASNGRITDVFEWAACCGDWELEPEDVPVPHDPATVGCFAAMARKATGRRLYAVPTIDGDAWQVCEPASFGENEPAETAPDGSFGHATEIEAWLAVLEATPSV